MLLFAVTPHARASKAAFSLIELLTVIAVIAILAGLLAPALARARELARASQCLSQMRQIALAIRLYADDNNDFFPRSQHSAFAHGELPWERAIAPQLGQGSTSWSNLLRNVYRCPTDRRNAPWSYGQNVYFELDPASDDYAGSPQTWRRLILVPVPAATILHAENQTAADHIMPQFWLTTADAGEVAQNRHAQLANYSFGDGHAGLRKFRETYAPDRQIDAWNPFLSR